MGSIPTGGISKCRCCEQKLVTSIQELPPLKPAAEKWVNPVSYKPHPLLVCGGRIKARLPSILKCVAIGIIAVFIVAGNTMLAISVGKALQPKPPQPVNEIAVVAPGLNNRHKVTVTGWNQPWWFGVRAIGKYKGSFNILVFEHPIATGQFCEIADVSDHRDATVIFPASNKRYDVFVVNEAAEPAKALIISGVGSNPGR